MVKTPDVRPDDEIEVEKFIDDFLREHFVLYSKYCMPIPKLAAGEGDAEGKKKKRHRKTSASEQSQNMADVEKQRALEDPNTTRYAYVVEDKQADDITLIAIRRP